MTCRCCISLLYGARKRPVPSLEPAAELGALGGTRTPNLLIRSQMLYPLSYERLTSAQSTAIRPPVRPLAPTPRSRDAELVAFRVAHHDGVAALVAAAPGDSGLGHEQPPDVRWSPGTARPNVVNGPPTTFPNVLDGPFTTL